jgi:hypothetical protein
MDSLPLVFLFLPASARQIFKQREGQALPRINASVSRCAYQINSMFQDSMAVGMVRSMVCMEEDMVCNMVLEDMVLGMDCSKDHDPSSSSQRVRKLWQLKRPSSSKNRPFFS